MTAMETACGGDNKNKKNDFFFWGYLYKTKADDGDENTYGYKKKKKE